jgi:hypothetical protein
MNAPHSFAAAALIVLAVTPEVQAQSMFDQMVAKKCAAAMQADFASAGKVPPAGDPLRCREQPGARSTGGGAAATAVDYLVDAADPQHAARPRR